MGNKKRMLPVEKVDMSAAKYEQQVIKGYEFFFSFSFLFLGQILRIFSVRQCKFTFP